MNQREWFGTIIILLLLTSCTSTTNMSIIEDGSSTQIEETNQDERTTPEAETTPAESAPGATEEMSTMTPDAPNPNEIPHVGMAKEDLAARLNISEDKIEVIKVEFVTWPDSAMGCPQPGMVYRQVPQDGLLIQLSVEGVTYNYHSGGSVDPFLCQPAPATKSTPFNLELEDFQTPPANDIDK